MYCKNCGKKLEDDWTTCPYCNEKVKEEEGKEEELKEVLKDDQPVPVGILKLEKFNFIKYLLLSLVTFGIYGIVVLYRFTKTVNILCEGDGKESPNYIVVYLLNIATIGVYGIYWIHKQAERLNDIAPKYNSVLSLNATAVLIWSTFGNFIGVGPFIAWYLMFKNINLLIDNYKDHRNTDFSFNQIPKRSHAKVVGILVGYYILFFVLGFLVMTIVTVSAVFDDSSEALYEIEDSDWSETENVMKHSDDPIQEDSYNDSEDNTAKNNTAENKTTNDDDKERSQEYERNTEISGNYILPDSSSRVLEELEIEDFSTDELQLSINEIYARHGRKFNDSMIQEYFDDMVWYHGTIESEDFTEDILSDIEKKNIVLIKNRINLLENGELDIDYTSVYGSLVSLASTLPNNSSTYYLWDIDNDGTKELILKEGTSESDYIISFYTYNAGQVSKMESISGTHSTVCMEQRMIGILINTSYMGYEKITRITKSENKIYEEIVYEKENSYGEYTCFPLEGCSVNSYELLETAGEF